jgi:hypothetical protein
MKHKHFTELVITMLAFIVVITANPGKTTAATTETASASAASPVGAGPPDMARVQNPDGAPLQQPASASIGGESPDARGIFTAPQVSTGVVIDVALLGLFIILIPSEERRNVLRIKSPEI